MMRLTEDISKGVEACKIAAEENGLNLNDLSDFVYIRKNIPGPEKRSKEFKHEFQGCSCSKGNSCLKSGCQCIGLFGASYDKNGLLTSVNPYHKAMKPVLECNKNCQCSSQCINRVVQHGVKCNLQVFVTSDKGLGVKTLDHIKKDTFVCEYAGEILTETLAKQRAELLTIEDSNYILVLREYSSTGKVQATYVDATYIANVGRFLNHSCEPNLYMVPVRVDCNVPKLALFAIRNIDKGEELCYDYSGEILENTETEIFQSYFDSSKRKKCNCGAICCRGVLPLDSTLYSED